MIIVMREKATEAELRGVIGLIRRLGLSERISRGVERTLVGAVGDERVFEPRSFEALPGVEKVARIVKEWRMISREARPQDAIVTVRKRRFGEGRLRALRLKGAGDDPEAALRLAARDPDLGEPAAFLAEPFADALRPYSPAPDPKAARSEAKSWAERCKASGIPVVCRIRNLSQLEFALGMSADVIYVAGDALNDLDMNQALGKLNVPLVLCKGPQHTPEDWLVAAERVALRGNAQIILGDEGAPGRLGPRLDVEGIAFAKAQCNLPILANISAFSAPNANLSPRALARIAFEAGASIVLTDPERRQAKPESGGQTDQPGFPRSRQQ